MKSWTVVWFVAFLCLMALVGSLGLGSSRNPFLPAFFSFLPISFLIIVLQQREAQKTIQELRTRIEVLERGHPELRGSHSATEPDPVVARRWVWTAMAIAAGLAILGLVLTYALARSPV